MQHTLQTILIIFGSLFLIGAALATLAILYYKETRVVRLIIFGDDGIRIKRYRPNKQGYRFKEAGVVKHVATHPRYAYPLLPGGRAYAVHGPTGLCFRPQGPENPEEYVPPEVQELLLAEEELQDVAQTAQSGLLGFLQRAAPWLILMMIPILIMLLILVYQVLQKVTVS